MPVAVPSRLWLPASAELGPRVPITIEREALIVLSDTIGDIPTAEGAGPVYDFDSILTSRIRNNGVFSGYEAPIGKWPEAASYGGVLLAELRQEQKRLLKIHRIFGDPALPDAMALEKSLGKSIIAILNCAPRTDEHSAAGRNGADFYIAELDDNLQLFAQAPYLQGVASRGLIRALWRVQDDNPVWPKGEQFRSSIVSQLRNFPDFLTEVDVNDLSVDLSRSGFLAFADKYGNSRIERRSSEETPDPAEFDKLQILIEGKELIVRGGFKKLGDIPEKEIGLYGNPADRENSSGPFYLELVRKVRDPNDPRNSAYVALSKLATTSGAKPDWGQIEIEINA